MKELGINNKKYLLFILRKIGGIKVKREREREKERKIKKKRKERER